jgi:hypothetical protein
MRGPRHLEPLRNCQSVVSSIGINQVTHHGKVRRRGRNRKSLNNPNSVERDLPQGGVQTLPYLYHTEIAMDWNRIEEHWKKLKGKIKQQWAYVTDDNHLNPIPARAAERSPRCRPPWNDLAKMALEPCALQRR